MLKQAIDWKSRLLLDFIRSAADLGDAQFKDLRRALMGNGDFELAESHRKYGTSKSVWAAQTSKERNKLFNRFQTHEIKNERIVTTTDGQSDVV